jgi:hypothetical protein
VALDLNFDPSFEGPLDRMRAEAARQGISTHFLSGVRSPEDQRQLYANYLAGKNGQPLPYPERGAVPLAATPGTSLHERGLAADLTADDPKQQAALWALAPKYGLNALGAKDPNHFQLASNAMVSRPHETSTAASSDGGAPPVDFRNSVYQTLIGKGLNSQQAMGAMYSLMGESGHGLDPSSYNANDPGGSMGFAQWNGPRRAGLQAVAKSMGVPETDPSAQLAYFNKELDGQYKGVIDKIKNNATTSADATRIWTGEFEAPKVNNWQQRFAAGAQLGKVGNDGSPQWSTPTTTPVVATPGPPKTVGEALAALTAEGKDDKGNPTQSPLEKLGSAFSNKPQQPQQQAAPPMVEAAPSDSGIIGPSQQLAATVMASAMKPLSWTSAAPGAGAGQQGLTLNSYGAPYG